MPDDDPDAAQGMLGSDANAFGGVLALASADTNVCDFGCVVGVVFKLGNTLYIEKAGSAGSCTFRPEAGGGAGASSGGTDHVPRYAKWSTRSVSFSGSFSGGICPLWAGTGVLA